VPAQHTRCPEIATQAVAALTKIMLDDAAMEVLLEAAPVRARHHLPDAIANVQVPLKSVVLLAECEEQQGTRKLAGAGTELEGTNSRWSTSRTVDDGSFCKADDTGNLRTQLLLLLEVIAVQLSTLQFVALVCPAVVILSPGLLCPSCQSRAGRRLPWTLVQRQGHSARGALWQLHGTYSTPASDDADSQSSACDRYGPNMQIAASRSMLCTLISAACLHPAQMLTRC
jgi:hypothetical protein